MCIAPWCATVNKCLELSGNISPIGRSYTDYDVCPFIVFHDFIDVILLDTFCCSMTGTASGTKMEVKIINTDTDYIILFFQTIAYYIYYFSGCTVSYRAAIHYKSGIAKSHTWLSNFTFTFHFPALEKEMATHSSILAWRIPGTAEPGVLPSMGSHRVGHDWSDLAAAAAWIVSDSMTSFAKYLCFENVLYNKI